MDMEACFDWEVGPEKMEFDRDGGIKTIIPH